MKSICVDAGFLIGLYDESDQHHEKAAVHFLQLFDRTTNSLLVPWPILYETVSTRMARQKARGIRKLEQDWKLLTAQHRLTLLSDTQFRDDAIEDCFKEIGKPPQHFRDLSLADRVIRKILLQRDFRIDGFITFNPKDFHDVCGRFGCELIY
jgi:predicted nucleic acid-binding protein